MAWMPRGKFVVGMVISAALIPCVQAAPPTGADKTVAQKGTSPVQRVRVDQFDLVQFKPAPDLGWTQARVTDFLDEQLRAKNNLFTLAELEILARQLSIQMKQAGLMFSRAQIADQEITNNTVQILFEDGVLGEIVVMDAQRTQPKLLVRPFMRHLQHTAVRDELDQALYQLDRLPGVDVFGFFSFTETPGVSRLNLRVVEETSWSALLHTDNYGSEALGRERLHATLDILNMSGWGDKLKLNIGRSLSQPGFFEGFAQYTLPVGPAYQPLRFLISHSDFNLGQGFEDLEIFGTSTLANMNYAYSLGFGPGTLTLDAGVSLSHAKIDSLFYSSAFLRESEVFTTNFGVNFTNLLASSLSQQVSAGVRVGQSEERSVVENVGQVIVDSDFVATDAQYSLRYFHEPSKQPRVTSLVLEAFSSSDPMPSISQTGFGGRYGIRGLPTGYFSADEGALLHFHHDSLLWPTSWPGNLHFFADAGLGRRLAEDDITANMPAQTAQFASAGFGYSWQKGAFRVSYEFGKLLHAELEDETATPEALASFADNLPSRHYLSLSYDLGEH